jgi:hypothetical protein
LSIFPVRLRTAAESPLETWAFDSGFFELAMESPPSKPKLGDLAEFLAALALGAMGRMKIPGEEVPVDLQRARWFIELLEELLASLSDDVDATERARIEQLLTQLRLAFVQA